MSIFVNCFGMDVEDGRSDLVILIDSSGSMGTKGFATAKSFVRDLLREVHVAFDATRIAIGTFSTVSRIHINYILSPSYQNNKCKFNEVFEYIPFSGGLTNIKGALHDAYNIFKRLDSNPDLHMRRAKTNKVVILISNSYGNVYNNRFDPIRGRDASGEAHILKMSGIIETYTIAMSHKADIPMLKSIAYDKSTFLYLDQLNVKSFARKIRGDPYENDYEVKGVDPKHCSACDRQATCGCNLISGRHRCSCKKGWYGIGEFNPGGATCFECRRGTYGDRYNTDCKSCPENSSTNYTPGYPAKSIKSCVCNPGYVGRPSAGIPCKPKPCPPPPAINFGNIVNIGVCRNPIYRTKCHYRCNQNYKMVSSRDYLTCTEKGVWDRPLPKCEMISCVAPWFGFPETDRIKIECSRMINMADKSYPAGTTCVMKCKSMYYKKRGNDQLKCLNSGQWDLQYLECGVSSCEIIPRKDDKVNVVNKMYNCFNRKLIVGERCVFSCPRGYELRGASKVIECLPNQKAIGKWSIDTTKQVNLPSCVDIESPRFEYPQRCDAGIYIKMNTLPGKSYAIVNFNKIGVSDNSGKTVSITCISSGGYCPYEMGKKYNIEVTSSSHIYFNATDAAGNWRLCRFIVKIKDKEPPKVVFCPNDIKIRTSKLQEVVTWTTPRFEDNCGKYPKCSLRISSNMPNGATFYLERLIVVRYTAMDPSNNINEDCTFTVLLERKTCGPINAPINGLVVKSKTIARPMCRTGYYPTGDVGMFYVCSGDNWRSITGSSPPIPDCTSKTPSNGVSQQVILNQYRGNCSDTAVQQQVRTDFKVYFGCNGCKIDVICGSGS